MKVAEKYEKSTIKKYGIAVQNFGPFQRQLQVLKSEQGRLQILQCCKANIQLCGNRCGGGIPECIQKTQQNFMFIIYLFGAFTLLIYVPTW